MAPLDRHSPRNPARYRVMGQSRVGSRLLLPRRGALGGHAFCANLIKPRSRNPRSEVLVGSSRWLTSLPEHAKIVRENCTLALRVAVRCAPARDRQTKPGFKTRGSLTGLLNGGGRKKACRPVLYTVSLPPPSLQYFAHDYRLAIQIICEHPHQRHLNCPNARSLHCGVDAEAISKCPKSVASLASINSKSLC